MAYGAELAGAGASAQFIYVWPSRELIERSWSWPAAWHEAFQDAASRIGLAVAIYLLDGSRLGRRLISLQLSIGLTKFRVKRRGSSIFITVVEFTGPDSPGPDAPGPDGPRQPSAVDGLVLGLHGSGKTAYLVVFHGHMPPIPAGELLSSSGAGEAPVLKMCRASPLQLPTKQLMALDGCRHGTRSAGGIAERGTLTITSGIGMPAFSPVLLFRLVSGQPIYFTRLAEGSERPTIPGSRDRMDFAQRGRCDASISKPGKRALEHLETMPSEDAQSDSRLEIEKSPFRHLRPRYLH